MGSISRYKTAAGDRWRVRYRKPDRSQTDKRGFRTKREAELFAATVTVDTATGRYVDPSRSRVLVAEWLASWLEGRSDLTPTSRERTLGIVRMHIVPALGERSLADLTHGQVQAWAGGLSSSQGPSSVRKIVNTLSGALEVAVRDGRLANNPAHGLKLPKVGLARKTYLTHAQVADLAAATDAKLPGAGYGTLVRVLAYCGLRWSELSGLRVGDLDAARGRLEVQHTVTESGGVQHEGVPKSHEARSVPVPASILRELMVLAVDRPPQAPLFTSSRSRGWLRNRVFRRGAFDAAAIEVGLEGLTPHELRHTAASLAISVGANVKAVQRMLGHASAAVTLDVYADLFDDDLDTVSDALDQAMLPAVVGKKWAGPKKVGRPGGSRPTENIA
ncbi:tyrosine-type recombinase/integrase [Frigoribacterium salinisoli]